MEIVDYHIFVNLLVSHTKQISSNVNFVTFNTIVIFLSKFFPHFNNILNFFIEQYIMKNYTAEKIENKKQR